MNSEKLFWTYECSKVDYFFTKYFEVKEVFINIKIHNLG